MGNHEVHLGPQTNRGHFIGEINGVIMNSVFALTVCERSRPGLKAIGFIHVPRTVGFDSSH
jgi:hypothetical protein